MVSSYICLQTLSRLQHEWDVYAVATCQEEVGTIGAETTAYRIEPDIALVVDVTFSKVPGISENNPCEIDKGPVLGIGPNMHPVVTKYLKDIATHLEIPLQSEIISGHSGTDAWYIQVSRHGVPTGLLSLPSRYMHTPIESVSIKDIERTGRLMAHFISSLDESFVDTLIPKDGFEEEV
ncbi:MAG: hypothetical protein B6242_10285 [Anaerolineaceae bacterium 4572_78]|nr:MAG: hypothetical protein B6242_10285 [Anaerolineaceae bacterium 4572_78]